MRPANWQAVLAAHIEQARRIPFQWGVHDCVTFSCQWFTLMTGRDVFAPWRGRYDSRQSAGRRIVEAGCDTMAAAGRTLFGSPRDPGAVAARGDIVLAREAFGIVTGQRAMFLVEPQGLEPIGRDAFDMIWVV